MSLVLRGSQPKCLRLLHIGTTQKAAKRVKRPPKQSFCWPPAEKIVLPEAAVLGYSRPPQAKKHGITNRKKHSVASPPQPLERLERPTAKKLYQPFGGSGNQPPKRYYGLLIVPIVTFCLGVWQVRRRTWKLDLIAKLHHRTRSQPLPIPNNEHELLEDDGWEYKPVTVTGEFDHSRELWIRPRSPVQDNESDELEYSRSRNEGSRSGANIVTAFKVKDRDLKILVNRGWVPTSHMDPNKRQEGQITGEQTITGIVRRPEKKIPFFKNMPETNEWFYRDQEAMAQELNTSPVFLDLVESCSPETENSPLGGQTRINLRNEHHSYLFIWFSLSILTSLVWFKKAFGRIKR